MSDIESYTQSPFNRAGQHRRKRQDILSEAAKLFNRQGTRSTTLAEIAERLKLTKTSLYYYVKTKEDLIYLCYLGSCEKQLEIQRRAQAAGTTGREKIECVVREYFKYCEDIASKRAAETAVLTEIKALKDQHRKDIAKRYHQLFDGLRAFIDEGIADTSLAVRDSTSTALALFLNLQCAVIWSDTLPPQAIAAAGESFLDISLNGLATRASPPLPKGPQPKAAVVGEGFDRQIQNQLKQEAFLRVGSQYFNSKGFKGTSLDEIAQALDVTKGAFYYHIQNKEDLLYQCYKRTLALTKAAQERADRGGANGLCKLLLCVHDLFCIQNSEAGPLVRYNLLNSLDAERKKEILELIKGVDQRFAQFVQQGINDGSIRQVDARVAGQLISGAINACTELSERREIADINQASADFFQLLSSGIACRRAATNRAAQR